MTVAEAIEAITNAANVSDASAIRNRVALEAMHGKRPEAEADACTDAFFDRWSDEVRRQHVHPLSKLPKLHFTGD